MRLYLVQHGQAKSAEEDPLRPLTAEGRADVEKLAKFLSPLGLAVGEVWHSGKARAAQTAEIMAEEVSAAVRQRDGLSPNDPVEPLAQELARAADDVMIVSHLPLLGRLASTLIAGKTGKEVVAFQQGGGVCLQRDEQRAWTICWMVVPALLA